MQVRRFRWSRANKMIWQIFGVVDGSCKIVWCKWESLIFDTLANKAVNTDKKWDTTVDKELNTKADKIVNADKRQDAAVEPSMLIKDQMIRWTKLEGWIRVK